MRSLILTSTLLTAINAFTPPTAATWGSLLTPSLADPVTQGSTFSVTWDPSTHETDGVTVSLVLCRGPGANCVTDPTAIVENVPAAAKAYSWSVPCDLPVGEASTATGYGMLIIVDGTGEFQYSTQFSVLKGDSCSSSSSSSSASASASASASDHGSGSWTTKGWGSSNATASMTSYTYTSSVPSSIVYASEASVSEATIPSATYPAATFTAPQSTFTGAAQPTGHARGVLGLVAMGAVGVLAL